MFHHEWRNITLYVPDDLHYAQKIYNFLQKFFSEIEVSISFDECLFLFEVLFAFRNAMICYGRKIALTPQQHF